MRLIHENLISQIIKARERERERDAHVFPPLDVPRLDELIKVNSQSLPPFLPLALALALLGKLTFTELNSWRSWLVGPSAGCFCRAQTNFASSNEWRERAAFSASCNNISCSIRRRERVLLPPLRNQILLNVAC
jgi:hypothetical protein